MTAPVPAMQRIASVIRLRPEHRDEYLRAYPDLNLPDTTTDGA